MAKSVISQKFSKSGRAKLAQKKPTAPPYFLVIAQGMHLGYKRTKTMSKWYARYHGNLVGDEREYVQFSLGSTDDYADADGSNFLDLAQAQTKLHRLKAELCEGNQTEVKRAMKFKEVVKFYHKSYLTRKGQRANPVHLHYLEKVINMEIPIRVQQKIKPNILGEVRVDKLTYEDLVSIRDHIANTPRKRPYKKRKYTEEELLRMRRSTANRFVVVIKAVLNWGYDHARTTHIKSNVEWRKFKKFRNIDRARQEWWSRDEAQRWLNHCNYKPLRDLFIGALSCGFRFKEQCLLLVSDVVINPDATSYVSMRGEITKTGNPRNVIIPTQFVPFFTTLIAGRSQDDFLFKRTDQRGDQVQWKSNAYSKGFKEVMELAKLPYMVWHSIRHTYASQLVMKGVKLKTVANQLGHTTTYYVEKWYGHLSDQDTLNEINKLDTYHNLIQDDAEVVKIATQPVNGKLPVLRDGSQPSKRGNFPVYAVDPSKKDELLAYQNDPRRKAVWKARARGEARKGIGQTIAKQYRDGEL